MSEDQYVQCKLKADKATMITWIPSVHKDTKIKVGTRISLDGGTEIFTVEEVYGTRPASEVKAHERDWKSQRQASDI